MHEQSSQDHDVRFKEAQRALIGEKWNNDEAAELARLVEYGRTAGGNRPASLTRRHIMPGDPHGLGDIALQWYLRFDFGWPHSVRESNMAVEGFKDGYRAAVEGTNIAPEEMIERVSGAIRSTIHGSFAPDSKDDFEGFIDRFTTHIARKAVREMGRHYPTQDAYMRACRALHWRTAELRANGIEPIEIANNAPHHPPDDQFRPSLSPAGWIVANGRHDRWRAWDQGMPIWTEDRAKATRYCRREDAEAVHAEDEDAWAIVPYAETP